MEPKGKLIHFYYAFTIPGLDNKIEAMESLLAELRDAGDSESLSVTGDHSYMIAPIINVLGYYYYGKGDKEKSNHFLRNTFSTLRDIIHTIQWENFILTKGIWINQKYFMRRL